MLTISFYKELAAGTEIVGLSRNDARLCISCALPRGASHFSAIMDFKTTLIAGLKLRVRNRKIIFLFLNQTICCGCSKEPSQ